MGYKLEKQEFKSREEAVEHNLKVNGKWKCADCGEYMYYGHYSKILECSNSKCRNREVIVYDSNKDS